MHQNVLWLYVSVNHIVAVGVVESACDSLGDLNAFLYSQLLLPIELIAQRLALDVWQHVVEERVGFSRIEQRQNVGMLQVGGDLNLLEEPLGAQHGGQLGPEDLDRHFSVVFEVLGEVDRGHAARAEFFLDDVAVSEGGFEAV